MAALANYKYLGIKAGTILPAQTLGFWSVLLFGFSFEP